MTKEQDHDELDLAEASVSPADGELPFQPSDATVLTANVEPNDDDVDSRMSEILLILDHAATRLLDKCALVAEWVGHAEAKASVFGQLVHKPRGGRPEGGIARAARELAIPGRSIGARRKFIERAITINGMWPEVKSAVRAGRLDDNQSALLAVASIQSAEAQIAKAQEIAARKAIPRRNPRTRDGDESAASSEAQPSRTNAINPHTSEASTEHEIDQLTPASKSEIDQSKPASSAALIEFAKFMLARIVRQDDGIVLTLTAAEEVKEFYRLANRARLAIGKGNPTSAAQPTLQQ